MTFSSANRRWILRAAVSVLALVGFVILLAGNAPRTAASQAEAPGVPQYVQISPGQSQELVVSWNAPASDGGSTITGYKVQWKEAAGSWDTPADVSETTVTGKTHTITGLTGGLEYAVRVIAVNDIGDGPPSSEGTCPGGGYGPDPTQVEVDAVPIVVTSTADDYFVLYVSHDVDGKEVEWPVLVKRGESGATTLAENLEALPAERYRVEKHLVADPADVDGDCVDDITELGDPVGMNPVNSAATIAPNTGAVVIPDLETFEEMSYEFEGNLHVKFVLLDMLTDRPGLYFQNSETYVLHFAFLRELDLQGVRGTMIYDPELTAPDGSPGVYRLELSASSSYYYSFGFAARSYTYLAASLPLLDDNLAFHIPNSALPDVQSELPLYRESRINILFDEDILGETDFLALNPGEGYGRLRVMEPDDRPNPRDIVIYEALPNELPRVAGIISAVPQTPLSHVNLRAVQDGVPNSFIRDALDNTGIDDLVDSHVHYTVTEDGWTLRAATPAEVDAHYASSRPATEQTPQRDLSVTEITPLSEVGFEDWDAFGVKAANVALLGTLGFPEGTVPDGFAVPFYFYDEFMKHNGFYDDIEEMLADPDFQTDFDVQEDELKDLRKAVKKGEMPEWITEELTDMHATYPGGQSLRYRSSTNNEDLPGFNGAGLYDSKTQHPEETEEDGIAKSLKQVYASLWNFRAFTERDFNRIDHLAAAMGVLVHPNYTGELANGVAVSFDPIYGLDGKYYVNTQTGEDLVTNPEAHSVPEEILLGEYGYDVLATSNQAPPGQLLMSDDQMTQLYNRLTVVHEKFEELYSPAPGERFAMEIEFKITSDDILAVKQARPWVFSEAMAAVEPKPNSPATGQPTIEGTAQVGETLTVDTSAIDDADGLDNVGYGYQWLADDADIAGATDPTYTLVDDDAGLTIKVQVSFFDDKSNPETLTSAATTAVAAAAPAPGPITGFTVVDASDQSVEGTLADGGALALDDPGRGSFGIRADLESGAAIGSMRLELTGAKTHDQTENIAPYSLYGDSGGNLSGESLPVGEYTLTATAYSEARLGGNVLGTLEVSFSVTETATQQPNTPATGLPTISGTAQVGETLTVGTSGIDDADGIGNATFSYQWIAGTTDISGATGSSYAPLVADLGKTIKVRVSFDDDDDNEETLTSEATATVIAAVTPLTAGFQDAPDKHDGTGFFTFDIAFSEPISISYKTLRDDSLEVANGSATRAKRVDGQSDRWEIAVEPDSDAAVTVVLPITEDCTNQDAVCSRDGTKLSNRSELTVPGPAAANSPATGAPIISGTAQVGETLTVDTSSIDDADGMSGAVFSYQWLANDAEITGATGDTYTLVEADVGKAVKVRVIFNDDDDNEETLTSPATAAVAAETAAPDAPRSLNVSPDDTGTLDASWEAPASDGGSAITGYRVQWKSGSEDYDESAGSTRQAEITDPASRTHTITGLTDGVEYTVRVIAVNDVGDGPPSDEATETPRETTPPELATATVDGTTLTLTYDEALDENSEPSSDAFSVTVVGTGRAVDGVSVSGSSVILTLGSAVASGTTVTVSYTAPADTAAPRIRDLAGNAAASFSNELVTNNTPKPNSPATGQPTITGTAQVGETLTMETSAIDDADGLDNVGYSYQWLANGADIAGATISSYTLVDADKGKTIQVKVSFFDDKNNQETLTSAATAAVEPRPNSPATGAPTISGTVRVGKTLTAETSAIADADGMSGAVFIYQWQADDAEIAGATSDAYTLVETDVGKAIKVRVTFRDDRNHQESLTSPATTAVAAADESAVWSATLTVGSIGGFRGFWKDVGMGELTPEVFTLDGVDHTVKVLADSDGPQFYLTLDKALPVGFTLQVGAATLSSQGASIREFSSGATQYGWATNQEAVLADVDTVEVSLTLAE